MKICFTSIILVLCICISGCSSPPPEPTTPFTPISIKNQLVRVNIVDHSNLSETITNANRLREYEKRDFLQPQPYRKVMRVFQRDTQGSTKSIITSYYENGQIQQYLECINGRASGIYLEWYENGLQKTQARILAGQADLDEKAFVSWSFDGDCCTFDEQGNKLAQYHYDHGVLDGITQTFYPTGEIRSTTTYVDGLKEGIESVYQKDGSLLQTVSYKDDLRNGEAMGYNLQKNILWIEEYLNDHLQNAQYFSHDHTLIAQVTDGEGIRCVYDSDYVINKEEIKNGKPEGWTHFFDDNGFLERSYEVYNGLKHGNEIRYFPKSQKPRILIQWKEGAIHGTVKTWYDTGAIESQKEMTQNIKNGTHLSWYPDGSMMMAEEYSNDKLIRGQYMKRGETDPISTVEQGSGTATLCDMAGTVIEKIPYKDGKPLVEES